MATVNLGRIKFVWQGAYSGATAYVADDVVSYNGSSYICILASTNNLPTNATYWNLMAQTGTDITSLAGLAQGDVLYYNGTSWVRLGAGTSGQFLKTNGSGANPAWATISSSLLQRKFYNFSDEAAHSTLTTWTNTIHPIGDGTLEITPTASGNIIQIEFSFYIGHNDTWQASKQRIQFSTDGGSTYTDANSLGGDGGYGGVNNYLSGSNTIGDIHSGVVWLATASANTHKFRWQYYGASGGAGFYLNYVESNMGGGTAHSRIIISEYANVSGITSGAL
jgi:hypothetical protein